jgi:hypothetical protein
MPITSTLTRPGRRLALFGALVLGVFAIGVAGGAMVDSSGAQPVEDAPAPAGDGVVAGLDGYRFVPERTVVEGDGGVLRFVIEGPTGEPVREFTAVHERDLHFILVNRELTIFHHLHPSLSDDGTWTLEMPVLPGGAYRAVSDFQVSEGPRLALGVDLSVAGEYDPVPLGEPRATAEVDGYEVALAAEVHDGGDVLVTMTVRRDGALVGDLEPYLGASGHLVAMRTGDLAYAHVHPADADHGDGAPGNVGFVAQLNAKGRYALFFDFQHDGVVRTAAFTFDQGAVADAPSMEH